MEPIRYELVENPVFVETDEVVFDGVEWEPGEFSNYMPEFLEDNNRLEYYMTHKSDYQYIASRHSDAGTDDMYIEYYYMDDDTIIAFLSSKPKAKNPKYYRVLEATMIYKKPEESFIV